MPTASGLSLQPHALVHQDHYWAKWQQELLEQHQQGPAQARPQPPALESDDLDGPCTPQMAARSCVSTVFERPSRLLETLSAAQRDAFSPLQANLCARYGGLQGRGGGWAI